MDVIEVGQVWGAATERHKKAGARLPQKIAIGLSKLAIHGK